MFSLKLKRWILTACLAGSMGLSLGANVLNASAATTDPLGTMSGISGVTFATQNGDASGNGNLDTAGKMFTTNKDSNPVGCELKSGYTIQTKYYGTTLTKDRLQVGQHLYDSETAKLVKVSKWVLTHPGAQCIHGPFDMSEIYHETQKCREYYNETNPGWIGYCADCGEMIQNLYYYMDAKTAMALDHIQMGYFYYYKCPFCKNLEQGSTTRHKCKEISWNRYKIEYKGNGSKVIGSMGNSVHMYNNVAEYEGNTLEKVQTSLSKNKYQRPGYSFVGWNTKSNGTGTSYTDEQEILNLTSVDGETINLYAQWEKCDTTLLIKAEDGTNATSGATYNGKAQYSTKVNYLATERVQKSLTTAGKGYKINFDTNGGTITGMGQTGLKNVNGTSGYSCECVAYFCSLN